MGGTTLARAAKGVLPVIFRCRIECGKWTKISLSASAQRKLNVGSSCTFSCLNCTFFRSRDMLFNPWWSWWLLLGRRRKVSGGVDGELSVSSASAQRRLILHFFRRLSVEERRSVVGGAQRYVRPRLRLPSPPDAPPATRPPPITTSSALLRLNFRPLTESPRLS